MNHQLWKAFVSLSALALIATACGNRLSEDEIRAQNVVTESGFPDGTSATGVVESELSGDLGGDTGGGRERSSGGGDAVSTPGQATQERAVAPDRNKEPIVVGLVGGLSGLGGSTMGPVRDAWVAWQRSVNARGGIDGHPVELVIGDDGGDFAVSVSIARDFVENKGAVALTYAGSGMPLADYAKNNSVPVIGSITTNEDWNNNPMLFPPFGGPHAFSWGTARLIKRAGATKVAQIYCAESQDCAAGAQRFQPYAEEEGLEVVAEIQYSVVQPDFTAECFEMQRAGAEAVVPTGDNNSIIRMGRRCAEMGFQPMWVTPIAVDSLAGMDEFEGAIGVTLAFPWFLRDGAPAILEYAAALERYAPNRLDDGSSFQAWGWHSAKLFEAAAARMTGQPTKEKLLEALASMQGETLGGLAPGNMARTFVRDQPTPETFCVFDARIVDGTWTAPQGLSPICR